MPTRNNYIPLSENDVFAILFTHEKQDIYDLRKMLPKRKNGKINHKELDKILESAELAKKIIASPDPEYPHIHFFSLADELKQKLEAEHQATKPKVGCMEISYY